ncbi:MAG: TerB family tellurite resistance protein [Deltaproteobacteria bacterium]|jgi:tellurite resistance protein|nr:TerB family tellurite resistance protein [Deltaproteobacteria bacterium]MBW2529835.1 TerB family tellurite resistance protein [Deltaproteobacteria bacterium]
MGLQGRPSFREKLYFKADDAKRREKMREKLAQAAKLVADRQAIAETLKVDDDELVSEIHDLGFDGDSARVFDLLPLIHVSWADGKIQKNERSTILAVLEARGIEPGSEASLLVESLLESQPAPEYMAASLLLLREFLASRGEQAGDVVELCVKVADAAGGLLGLGSRISEEERELLQQIADTLGAEAQKHFAGQLSGK